MPENEKSFFKYVLHDKKNKKRQYIYKKCIIIYKETQQTNEKTCAKIIKKINSIDIYSIYFPTLLQSTIKRGV